MSVNKYGSFLGKGWKFPFAIDSDGSIGKSEFERSVTESIHILLSTTKGERVMRPDFGCEINEMVFAPNSGATRSMVCYYIEQALNKWEPRIILDSVHAKESESDETRLDVSISYRIRSINTYFNMVYPYFLERGERDTQSQLG